ncbi:MAG: type II secretion system F family protein [Propioniciclava sp.]
MSILIGALPGLVAALVVWLLALGIQAFRTNPLEELSPEVLVGETGLGAPPPTPTRSLPSQLGGTVAPTVRSALPTGTLRRLQRLIDLAGRPPGVSVDSVLAQQAGLFLISLPAVILFVLVGSPILGLLLIPLTLLWPLVRLTTTARKRREQIDRDMPDFLDVLAVTVTAGIGFRSALDTVSLRFGGPLGEEITTTLQQIANGATLRSAFTDFQHRTDSTSVEEFVRAYLQAEELGAPLVDSLNQIATDLRSSAAQQALQKAAGIAPRITLITTLVMVPAALILVVVGLFIGVDVDLGAILGG